MRKLSERALLLLEIIDASTTWEGDERPGRRLTRYFIPNVAGHWVERLKTRVFVSTGGDAAALRGLETKSLIRATKPGEGGSARYYFAITEDGIAALAAARETRR